MNKLMILDLVLLIAVVILFFVKSGTGSDILTGGIAGLFVISITNHLKIFVTKKKFY